MTLALFSLLLLTPGTTAATSQPDPSPGATVEAPKEERKICKREQDTKSRMGWKRVCLSAAEWKSRNVDIKGLGDVTK